MLGDGAVSACPCGNFNLRHRHTAHTVTYRRGGKDTPRREESEEENATQ